MDYDEAISILEGITVTLDKNVDDEIINALDIAINCTKIIRDNSKKNNQCGCWMKDCMGDKNEKKTNTQT